MEYNTINLGEVEGFSIAPIGDIQYTGRGFTKTFQRYMQDIRTAQSDQWPIIGVGLGDYIDFASPSNRQRLKNADLYDSAMEVIDDAAERITNEVYEELSKTPMQWAGLVTGHHMYDFRDGTTSDTRLCEMLGTKHLGDSAFVRIQLQRHNTRYSYMIWVHHGAGNGASKSYGVRKLETRVQPYFEADLYLMGHTTGRGAIPIHRVYPCFHGDSFKLKHKERWMVNTGGFAESYPVGNKREGVAQGCYAEKGMMAPAVMGAPLIHVRLEDEGLTTKVVA